MSSATRLQSFLSNSLGVPTTLHHGPGNPLEPSVLLIVAGGTICMQESADGLVTSKLFLDDCLSTKPIFNDGTACPTTAIVDEHGVTRDAPVLRLPRDRSGANVRCTVLEFNPLLDSSTAHAPTWNQLAGCIRANEPAFDAFVICHGTDTLAYTAAALSFLLMPTGLRKTVIMTGAQRSMFFADSDGADNLLGSIVLASHVRIPEVCVYFGHRLLRGTRVTKVSASNYAGFASPNAPPLATVSEKTGIVVHWDNLRSPFPPSSPPPHPITASPSAPPPTLPVLDASLATLVKVYPGFQPAALTAVIAALPRLRGLVLETFGAGNLPLALIPPLAAAIRARGLVVVNVTQCLHGAVSAAYEPARKLMDAGILLGGDMTSEAALTKLVWLLSAFPDRRQRGEVVRGLKGDVCGEVTIRREEEDEADLAKGRGLAWLPIRYERTVLPGRESRL